VCVVRDRVCVAEQGCVVYVVLCVCVVRFTLCGLRCAVRVIVCGLVSNVGSVRCVACVCVAEQYCGMRSAVCVIA
jgi:hypothetical protein